MEVKQISEKGLLLQNRTKSFFFYINVTFAMVAIAGFPIFSGNYVDIARNKFI